MYSFRNATAKQRFSLFDITEKDEEEDPLNERFSETAFCPYCGSKVEEEHRFCGNCKKKLSE